MENEERGAEYLLAFGHDDPSLGISSWGEAHFFLPVALEDFSLERGKIVGKRFSSHPQNNCKPLRALPYNHHYSGVLAGFAGPGQISSRHAGAGWDPTL